MGKKSATVLGATSGAGAGAPQPAASSISARPQPVQETRFAFFTDSLANPPRSPIQPLSTVARTPLPPLLYADTATSSDQLYFSRVSVHDPFIAFGAGGKRITVQSALEFGRIKKARTFDAVLPLE